MVGVVVVILILLALGIFWIFEWASSKGVLSEDCVPASCCHSDSCVWKSEAPDCGEVFCTMNCEPGTMDCGAGHCEVVDSRCEVVWDE